MSCGCSIASVFAALAMLPVPVSAQSTAQDAELARAAKNPYDLARFVDSHVGFDWNVVWRSLGVKPSTFQPCGNPIAGWKRCWAELITVLNPDQVILLVHGELLPADLYLRFMQVENVGWRFSGAHFVDIHHHRRRHEVDRSSGKPFLRISADGVHGSDVDSEIEDWFDLTQTVFEPVFSFVLEGREHVWGAGISRRVSGSVSAEQDIMRASLLVDFFGADGGGEHFLGTGDYTAVYARTPGAKKFGFEVLMQAFVAQR